jgi:hypothetical protein
MIGGQTRTDDPWVDRVSTIVVGLWRPTGPPTAIQRDGGPKPNGALFSCASVEDAHLRRFAWRLSLLSAKFGVGEGAIVAANPQNWEAHDTEEDLTADPTTLWVDATNLTCISAAQGLLCHLYEDVLAGLYSLEATTKSGG